MNAPKFRIAFINRDALKEYRGLGGSTKQLVDNGLARLAQRADEIGKPLVGPLAGCKELKFRSAGIRVIFRIVDGGVEIVEVVAIGRRDKGEVFDSAAKRINR